MSKNSFKSLVKLKVTELRYEYLFSLKSSHSKTKYLNIQESMQGYLFTEQLTVQQKQLLMNLRIQTAHIKTNYKNKFKNNMLCRYGCMSEESYIHLLQCNSLIKDDTLKKEASNISVEYIYGSLSQQIQAIQVWTKIFKIIKRFELSH